MRTIVRKTLPFIVTPLLFELPLAHAETCEETLKVVQELYNRTVDSCYGGDPASDCSGLLIRGTHRADAAKGQKYDVWNASPQAEAKGTIAFSYLRKDINFDDSPLETSNGLITTPMDYLCAGQGGAHVQCAFVSDGWTDTRSDRGCGDNSLTANVEGYCQDTGITTASAWMAQFQGNQPPGGVWGAYPYQAQCAFDMAKGRGTAGRQRSFQTFLETRRQIGGREFTVHNEVRVSNPGTDKLPVLAFFTQESRGLVDALANQRDYYARTGNFRPVITVKFAKSPGDVTTFSCVANQMQPPPGGSTPGFCKAGRAPSPGFGLTPVPLATPVPPGGQATQAAQAAQAVQAVQAAQASQAQAAIAAATAAAAQFEARKCKPYIASSHWVERSDPVYGTLWTLAVTPTACGRNVPPDQTEDMYAELYNKHSKDWQWRQWDVNGGSMRRQLVCHIVGVRGKDVWNLEPRRPYVTQNTALNLPSPCNPTPADAGK